MLITIADTCTFGQIALGSTDQYGVECYFTGIDGWGAPQSTVDAVQRGSGDGGFATPAFLQSRVFTVSGAFLAPDRPNLVAAVDRLNASAALSLTKVTVTSGGAARYVWAQRQGAVEVSEVSDTAAQFTIQFLAVDPRKFGTDLTVTTGLPSATGGLQVPFTVPFTISSTIVSGTCTATNPGNAVGPVTLRIDGPVTGPTVTHVGSGAALIFSTSYTLIAGNWLIVDMENHTVLENGQAERNGWVLSRGWSGFEPGVNVWAFTASVPSSSLLTVTATPAWT